MHISSFEPVLIIYKKNTELIMVESKILHDITKMSSCHRFLFGTALSLLKEKCLVMLQRLQTPEDTLEVSSKDTAFEAFTFQIK